MSTTIDQRVVEMRFDNKNFESNVSTTMSTLEKLKQKLNFTGATKGLDNIGSMTKKIDMTSLASSVDTVSARFSALDVIGVTALANLTNSAVNAGKKIVSALTIEPIQTGFKEYETQMNSVQTILANTQSKGSTLEDVNNALDTLNTYADQTIYNFTEMTRNIGTFTAAGVDLQTSVDSIKGIANLAAVAGSSSQQASTAMYQLSQALAAGKVSLMDWNSVVNAGMGGELFQNALIRTSELLKTGAKDAINTYGSFRESLTKSGWLTTEVLTETLKQLSGAYTEADLIGQGFTEAQAKEIIKLANTATDAATKVKTFSQLWDVMKESAQSGWAQTWKLIIGDFEQAKSLLTPLADFMTGTITSMSEARNKLLESALGKSISDMFKGIDKAIGVAKKSIDGVMEPVEKVTTALDDLGKIVDDVILGKFGNGADRVKAMTDAGINYYRVQNKVNESLGNAKRFSDEQIKAQDELLKTQKKVTETKGKEVATTEKLTDSDKKLIAELAQLSDEQLRSKGYTEEQIEAFNELRDTADKLGLPIGEFINNLDQINGRWLLINSFKNVGQGLVQVFTAMGRAWRDVFPPMTSKQLFDIIAGLHKLTSHLRVSDETAKKFERTFKGVFAALDIVFTVIGGPLKLAFNILTDILGAFDMNILDFTAKIGDAIVEVRNWIDETLDFGAVFKKIIPYIKQGVDAVRDWIDGLKETENLPQAIAEGIMTGLSAAIRFIKDSVSKLGDTVLNGFKEIPGDISDGFIGGILDGMKLVGQTMFEFGKLIIAKVKDALDSHSPSREFFKIGKDTITGFLNGLKEMADKAWDWLKGFGKTCVDILSEIDLGTIIAAGLSIGMITSLNKIGGALESLSSPLEGLGDVLKSVSTSIKANSLKDLATAIAILVGSLVVLTLIDHTKVWESLGILALLAIGIGALFIAINRWGATDVASLKDSFNVAALSGFLISIGVAVLLIAGTMKILSTIDGKEAENAFVGLAGIIGSIAIVLGAYGTLVKGKAAQNVDKAGKLLRKMATSLLILAIVAKIVAGMEWSDMGKAAIGIGGLAIVIGALIAVTSTAGPKADKAGIAIQKIAAAMLLLTIVAKIIAGMKWADMGKAAIGIAGLGLIVAGLVKATSFAGGKNLSGVGKTLIAMGTCMLLLAIVMRLIGGMEWADMGKAIVGLAGLAGVIAALIKITTLSGDGAKLKGVGKTLLTMSISIGILAGIAAILGLMEIDNLAKGLIAVGLLSSMVAMMTKSMRGAQGVTGSMIAITVTIGMLVSAAVALSLIDTRKLITSVGAIAILLGSFAFIIRSVNSMKGIKMGPLITIGAVIGLLSGLVVALSLIETDNALPNAAALGILLTSLSLSMNILSKTGPFAERAIKPAMMMGLVIAELALVLGVMASKVKNVDALIPTATSISILLVALATVCRMLIPIGAMGSAAIMGAGVLIAVIALLGATTIAIGEIMSTIPQEKIEKWQTGIDKFMQLLKSLASGLGEAIGAFVGGIAEGVLESVGRGLSAFMNNAKDFIEGARTVDESVLEGAGILAASIIALTVADFVNGVANLLPHSDGLAQLGTDLSTFLVNAKGFIDGVKNVDPKTAEGVKSLTQAILTLTAANFLDGITRLFSSKTSLADFGKELETFGPSMAAYAKSVAGIDTEAVKASATAAKTLAEMAAAIPNEGGILSKIVGENSVDVFGAQLVSFGASLKAYGVAVTGIAIDPINVSIEAAKSLSTMAESIPNMGGLVAWFTGDNDLATFGTQLVSFGSSLKMYGLTVTGLAVEPINLSVEATKALAGMNADIPNIGGLVSWFTGDNDLVTFGTQLVSFGSSLKAYAMTVMGLAVEPIYQSVLAARALADLAKVLPSDGGFWSWLKDDTVSMSDFGAEIVPLGEGMKAYSDEVAGINISAIMGSVAGARYIAALMRNLVGLDTSGVGPFVTALGTLGTASVEKFISAFKNANGMLNTVGADMIRAIIVGVTSRQASLTSTITSLVTNLISTLTSQATRFQTMGTMYMQYLATGATSQIGNVASAITGSMSNVISTLERYYFDFYSVGAYLVKGFAAGITANTFIAEARAAAMARAALEAAMAELDIASPSKAFYQVGDFAGLGFVNALGEYADKSYRAGRDMASSAKTGLSESISKIQKIIDGEMDVQPTIRPVLDLSDVQNGTSQINSLFADRAYALAGVNASYDGRGMNNFNSIIDRMQNLNDSSNSKVVDAISNLRGDFGSLVQAIGGMSITMDGNTVVGSLISRIDNGLGQIATHKGSKCITLSYLETRIPGRIGT